MAGLSILKYSENLSDERLCEVWAENPYFQYFCGEEFFQHKLVFDRSSLTRWRQRMGEDRLSALIQESLAVAAKTGALKPSELTAVVVDTLPARAHDDIGALLQNMRQRIGMHEPPIGDQPLRCLRHAPLYAPVRPNRRRGCDNR